MAEKDAPPAGVKDGEALDDAELGPGTNVGEHVIVGLLARGGCGAVYDARHQSRGTRGAVKVLRAQYVEEKKMIDRFLLEVDVVRSLRHPNIVSVHEAGVLADAGPARPYFVMEYLAGGTLDDLLRLRGRLTAEEALAVLAPVCAGLDAAHAEGVIHRDVKASNIAFACPREVLELPFAGPAGAVKLLDFGIAKLLTPEPGRGGLTTVGRPIGTPTIMAPEQLRGEPIDPRVDVYALGVLLYRLVTGRTPFDATTPAALARKHLEDPAPRPSLAVPVSPAIDAIVLRCMEKRPERRFESAGAVALALAEAVDYAVDRSSTELTAPAAGVAIDVELAFDTSDDELDDALAADVESVLDRVEERLRAAGFAIVQATGDGALGVRVLRDDPALARDDRRAALEAAGALFAELERRPRRDDRLEVRIAVHADEVFVRGVERIDVVGGPLLRAAAWVPADARPGVTVTPAAALGLPDWESVAVSDGAGRKDPRARSGADSATP